MSLFGYRVDAVVANRLLPDAVTDPWFDRWKDVQAEHLATIDEGFDPLPVLRVELADTEVVGFDRLRTFGEAVYGDLDAAAILHDGELFEVEALDDGRATMVLPLPFATKDEIDLSRSGEELLVRVGAYRRVVMLPDTLRRRTVVGAALRDETLRVTFSAVRRTQSTSRAKSSAKRES